MPTLRSFTLAISAALASAALMLLQSCAPMDNPPDIPPSTKTQPPQNNAPAPGPSGASENRSPASPGDNPPVKPSDDRTPSSSRRVQPAVDNVSALESSKISVKRSPASPAGTPHIMPPDNPPEVPPTTSSN